MANVIDPEIFARACKAADMREPVRTPVPEWKPTLAGAVIEESAGVFARRSGRGPQYVYAAIVIGFIPGKVEPSKSGRLLKWTVLLDDRSDTMSSFMDRLDELSPALSTTAERRWYSHARRLTGRHSHRVPDHWIETYARRADPFDGDTHLSEIVANISCTEDEADRVKIEIERLRTGIKRAPRVPRVKGDVREALRKGLGAEAHPLTGTCLDPDIGMMLDPPTAELAGRLLSIRPEWRPMAIAATLDIIENAELAVHHDIPLALFRLAEVLADVRSEGMFQRRVREYLAGRHLPFVSDWQRIADVYTLYTVEREMRSWATSPTSSTELREWLLTIVPVVSRDQDFFDFLEKYHDDLRNDATGRRRERVDPMVQDFDRMLIEAEAIFADAETLHAECVVAHAAADAAAVDDYRFTVELPVRDVAHADTGRTFLLDLRSVRIGFQMQNLVADNRAFLGRDPSDDFFSQGVVDGRRFDPEFNARRMVVIDGPPRFFEGDPERGSLSFLDPYVCGANLTPRHLTDDQVDGRRRYLSETGMPSARLSLGNVLTGDGQRERKIAVYSLARRGEVVIPLDALLRGLSIGRLTFRLISMTHVRITTARQIIEDRQRGWTSLNGKAAFLSIPKLPHELRIKTRTEKQRAYALDTGTAKAVKRNFQLIRMLDGPDPEDPKKVRKARVGSLRQGMPRECGDDHYAYQVDGRLMNISEIRYCLSFLFRRRLMGHDPRHISATVRHDEGASMEEVANAMGSGRTRAKSYMERGSGAVRQRDGTAFIAMRDGLAQLGGRGRTKAGR